MFLIYRRESTVLQSLHQVRQVLRCHRETLRQLTAPAPWDGLRKRDSLAINHWWVKTSKTTCTPLPTSCWTRSSRRRCRALAATETPWNAVTWFTITTITSFRINRIPWIDPTVGRRMDRVTTACRVTIPTTQIKPSKPSRHQRHHCKTASVQMHPTTSNLFRASIVLPLPTHKTTQQIYPEIPSTNVITASMEAQACMIRWQRREMAEIFHNVRQIFSSRVRESHTRLRRKRTMENTGNDECWMLNENDVKVFFFHRFYLFSPTHNFFVEITRKEFINFPHILLLVENIQIPRPWFITKHVL